MVWIEDVAAITCSDIYLLEHPPYGRILTFVTRSPVHWAYPLQCRSAPRGIHINEIKAQHISVPISSDRAARVSMLGPKPQPKRLPNTQ
jgi:hypothetical protein